jgi:two-component system, LytTR family, response regulator
MYSAIIVEDEMHSRELLKNMLAELCKEISVIATASSVQEGVMAIKNYNPDLVFLDIEMQTGTGFDLLQQFPKAVFDVIFVTAYNHYAIKAIKFSAVDYLLKPVDAEELTEAVSKVIQKRKDNITPLALQALMNNLRRPSNTPQTITLATSDGLEFIPLPEIIHIEANGPYSIFFLKDERKIMVSKNLKEYELLLSEHNFLRIHNSHIININEVKRMIKTDGGYAIMSNGAQLIISPKRKDDFLKLIGENNLTR